MSQLIEVASFERSVNSTVRGTKPFVGLAVKSATGSTKRISGYLSVILPLSETKGISIIPSPSESLSELRSEKPRLAGVPQKLPPRVGPPIMFLPGVFSIYQTLLSFLMLAL